MFNKRIVNENGEIKCSACGEYKSADQFYKGKNQCIECYNEVSKAFHKNDLKSRVRSAYQSQLDRAKVLTFEDDLTCDDVKRKMEEQNYMCPCGCGKLFEKLSDFEICHIKSVSQGGHLTYYNIQLLCRDANSRMYNRSIMYMIPVVIGAGKFKFKFDWNH